KPAHQLRLQQAARPRETAGGRFSFAAPHGLGSMVRAARDCDAVAGALLEQPAGSKHVLQPWSARGRSEAVAAPRILVTPRPGTHTEPDAASTDRSRLRGRARTAGARLRAPGLPGWGRVSRTEIAPRTRPLLLVLPRTCARL